MTALLEPARVGQKEPHWYRFAACQGQDPEMFFPIHNRLSDDAKSGQVVAAKKICRRCLVRQQCLDWALEQREGFGIWGGLTPAEREAGPGDPA